MPGTLSVNMVGVRDAARGMLTKGREKARFMGVAMLVEGEELMVEAQLEVPRRTGFLANSRFVTLVERGPFDSVVIVGFSASYALQVHEASSKVSFRVGKRKFLEDPWKRREAGAPARVAATIRKLSGD